MADSKKTNPNDDCMLLALPRELRDEIYRHYIQVEGGYVYNFKSGKLTCATPAGAQSLIDLRLMLSCRQIAVEMTGLALKTNTVTFDSVSPDAKQCNLRTHEGDLPYWWGRVFASLLEEDYRQTEDEWWPVPNFDESVYRTVVKAFPKFEPHLRTIRLFASDPHRLGDRFDDMQGEDFPGEQVQGLLRSLPQRKTFWGEAPSLQRQAALETLRLIVSRGCWSQIARSRVDEAAVAPDKDYWIPNMELASDVLRYHSLYNPWTIFEDDAICDIYADTGHPANYRPGSSRFEEYSKRQHGVRRKRFGVETRRFLSAASLAIHFLERHPNQRTSIRSIILKENHPCEAYSECHGLGLIEFCKENPHLRVERRASLWRNIWQTGWGRYKTWEPDGGARDGIHEMAITEPIARWVVEALALVPAGMPPGSFTLVLDGDPAPEQCTQMFQRVQRDTAWHTALGQSFDRGHLPETAYHERRRHHGYMYEDFPQALLDISTGSCSAVRANFDVGEPWDVEAMVEAHRGWTLEDWDREWALDVYYQTAPPLVKWEQLLKEVYMPRKVTSDR